MSSIVSAPHSGARQPHHRLADPEPDAGRDPRPEVVRDQQPDVSGDRPSDPRPPAAETQEHDAPPQRETPHRARRWRTVRPRSVEAVARVGRRVATQVQDAGMATAEYAIATLAAVGFAGLLVVLLKSDVVRGLLTAIIKKALQA